MLGEVDHLQGDVHLNGHVFYVSQQSWLFPASIRQNITFGNEFIREKFDLIVHVCALTKDLNSLPQQENTQIGEKGINLSGGQRARICLLVKLFFIFSLIMTYMNL